MKKNPTRSGPLAAGFGLSLAALSHPLFGMDATWQGATTGSTNDASHNWSNTANWNSADIPDTAGDTATVGNLTGNTRVYLNGAIVLRSLSIGDLQDEWDIDGGTTSTLTFASGDLTTPLITVANNNGGAGTVDVGLIFRTLSIAGSQGLTINAAEEWTGIRFNSGTNWSGFSGTLTIERGYLAPQAGTGTNTVLPTDDRIALGTAGLTNWEMNGTLGRNATIGSLSGTSNAYIFSGGGTATLTLGDATTGGDFAGTIGQRSDGAQTANAVNLIKQNAGTQTISGAINGGGAVTVNANSGTLHLSGNNGYTGVTTINAGGTVTIGHANALGATAGATSLAGGTLDLNAQTTAETLNISGGTLSNTSGSAATLSSDANVTGNFTVNTGGDITATRFIGTGAPRTLIKEGDGTLTTNGISHNNLMALQLDAGTVVFANTSGFGADRGVTINAGTLRLSGANANLINDDQAFTVNGGAFDLNGKNETTGAVSGSEGVIRNDLASTSSTVTVGGGNTSGSYAGSFQDGNGTLSLVKTGSGIQTISGNSTYSGTTTVSAGTLYVNGTLSNSAVTVDGGKFGGSSSNIGGGVTVGAGGILAPGNSIGTLGLASADIDGLLEIEFGTGSIDLLNVAGVLDITKATVSFIDFAGPLDGTSTYVFATYGSLVGDQFAVGAAPVGYTVDYDFGGNSIALVAVPEAAPALLGALGLLLLLRRRRP